MCGVHSVVNDVSAYMSFSVLISFMCIGLEVVLGHNMMHGFPMHVMVVLLNHSPSARWSPAHSRCSGSVCQMAEEALPGDTQPVGRQGQGRQQQQRAWVCFGVGLGGPWENRAKSCPQRVWASFS